MLVLLPLPPAHRSGGNHTDQTAPQREDDEQESSPMGPAEGVRAGLGGCVRIVPSHDQRQVEEHLLAFGPCDAVALPALVGVGLVPLEAGEPSELVHARALIVSIYLLYTAVKREGSGAPAPGLLDSANNSHRPDHE